MTYDEEHRWRHAGELAIRMEMDRRVDRRLAQLAEAKATRRRAEALRVRALSRARGLALVVPAGGVGV